MRLFGAIICESKDVALGEGSVKQFTFFEHKRLFSIWTYKWGNVGDQMRFHTHAFWSFAITLWGSYTEQVLNGRGFDTKKVRKLWWPRFLPRNYCHRITGSKGARTVVFAGPWHKTWAEFFPDTNTWVTYTWGRKVIRKSNTMPKELKHWC